MYKIPVYLQMEQASQASSSQWQKSFFQPIVLKQRLPNPSAIYRMQLTTTCAQVRSQWGHRQGSKAQNMLTPLDETSRFAVGIGYSEGNSFHLKLTFNTLCQEKKKCGYWSMDGNHCTVPHHDLKLQYPVLPQVAALSMAPINQAENGEITRLILTCLEDTQDSQKLCARCCWFLFFF